MSDGTISVDSGDRAIGISGSDVVIITGGTINVSGSMSYGIDTTGGETVTITGGTISSTANEDESYGIYNQDATVTITGGTISSTSTGDSYGIYNQDTDYGNRKSIVTVAEGKISALSTSSDSYGLYNEGNGLISIGDETKEISKDNPLIIAVCRQSSNCSGIGVVNILGTINFYNGMVQGTHKGLSGNLITRDGYQLENSLVDNFDSIYLIEKNSSEYIAQIDEIQYHSLQEAINSIEENEEKTIEILKSFELNESIKFNKNVILDLKGYTITNRYYLIENIKNLKIIDTTTDKQGKIDGTTTRYRDME